MKLIVALGEAVIFNPTSSEDAIFQEHALKTHSFNIPI